MKLMLQVVFGLVVLALLTQAVPSAYFYESSTPYLVAPRSSENCNNVRKQFADGYILLAEFMQRIRSCSEPTAYSRQTQPISTDIRNIRTNPMETYMTNYRQNRPLTSYSDLMTTYRTYQGNPLVNRKYQNAVIPALRKAVPAATYSYNYNQRFPMTWRSRHHPDQNFVYYTNSHTIQPFRKLNARIPVLPAKTPTPSLVRKVYVSDRQRGHTPYQDIDRLITQSTNLLDTFFSRDKPNSPSAISALPKVTKPVVSSFHDPTKNNNVSKLSLLLGSTVTRSKAPLPSPTITFKETPKSSIDDDFDITAFGLNDDGSFLDTGPKTGLAQHLTLNNLESFTSQLHEAAFARSMIRNSTEQELKDLLMAKLQKTAGNIDTLKHIQNRLQNTKASVQSSPPKDKVTAMQHFASNVPFTSSNDGIISAPTSKLHQSEGDEDAEYEKVKQKLLLDIQRRQMLLQKLESDKIKRKRQNILTNNKNFVQVTSEAGITSTSLGNIFKQIAKRTKIPTPESTESLVNYLKHGIRDNKSFFSSDGKARNRIAKSDASLLRALNSKSLEYRRSVGINVGRRKLSMPMIKHGLLNGNIRD